MALFSIPELHEQASQARKSNNKITIAIAHSDLGSGDATHILEGWSQKLIDLAQQKGFNVVNIGGSDLTHFRMTEILMQTRPKLLINFSHGCKNYLIGNDLSCTLTNGFQDDTSCGLCSKSSNLGVLKGTAVVAFSCHTGAQLAKCAIKYGVPMYIGFSDSLVIVSDKFGTQDIFRDALMPMAIHLLDGWTAGAAVEMARAELYSTVKSYKAVELISVPLWYNRKYLTQLGDPGWKLIGGN